MRTLVSSVAEQYGWEKLAKMVNINCFKNDPYIKSSLKFLRKTQWARDKVEQHYLDYLAKCIRLKISKSKSSYAMPLPI